ncbi:MAG: IclR family transcriptional regulator [Pigmentiphaga sp.]
MDKNNTLRTNSKTNALELRELTATRGDKPLTIRPVPAVKRSIDILFLLAASKAPRGVTSIARELDIQPSSCLHILRELAAGGLVHFDAAGKAYSLGPAVLTLARKFEAKDPFVEVAQPHLDRIARDFGVKTTASVYDGHGHIIVVASAADNDSMHIHIRIGMRVPMLASATGKLIGAFGAWSDDVLRREFAELTWQRSLSFEDWKAQLGTVRNSCLAADEGQYRIGITVLAVPVFGRERNLDKFMGASVVSEQLDSQRLKQLGEALNQAAQVVAKELE